MATLVGAAVLIWRHWDQLKAVAGGFLSGLWQGLRHCARLWHHWGPLFEHVGQTIGRVWQWFVDLFAPQPAVIILVRPFKNFITYAFKFCGECPLSVAMRWISSRVSCAVSSSSSAMAHDGGFECRRCKAVQPFILFQARARSPRRTKLSATALLFLHLHCGHFVVSGSVVPDHGSTHWQETRVGGVRYRPIPPLADFRLCRASLSSSLYLPLFVPVKV